jgi:hypothetical protein
VGLQKPPQGKIGDDIAIVAEDGLVLIQEIFDVFQSPSSVQKDWLMAKSNGDTAPSPVREFLRIDFRPVMCVNDESINSDFQEMIHYVGDDGTSSDLQERLWKLICQRLKPRS